MLTPKRRRLKDHNLCFYGCEFNSNPELLAALHRFLKPKKIAICPEVEPGEWLWQGLTTAMDRCAFCVFETVTANTNAHIELGYALAKRLRIAVLVKNSKKGDSDITKRLPSNLVGLVQVRFDDCQQLSNELESKIPGDWYSVEKRLENPLRLVTDLDRAYFTALLHRPPDRPIRASELVVAPLQSGVSDSSNNSVAMFLSRYDEVLEIEDLMPPPEIIGRWYDRWTPASPNVFENQRIRLDCDPRYRKWLAKALNI